MKRTVHGYRAHQLEHLQATSRGDHGDDAFYVIEGFNCLFRKITRVRAEKMPVSQYMRCFFQTSMIDLVPSDKKVHDELAEARLGWEGGVTFGSFSGAEESAAGITSSHPPGTLAPSDETPPAPPAHQDAEDFGPSTPGPSEGDGVHSPPVDEPAPATPSESDYPF